MHDGFTDTLYVLLPLWQAQFALSYAAIGVLRAIYTGVMAGLQVPTARLAQRLGGARLLAAGTALAALAYLLLGASFSVVILAGALALGGIGSSTQHPIASSLVAEAYAGPRSRGALGTYNFAGDLGKMALPSIAAGLIAVMSWRSAASAIGLFGLFGAGAVLLLLLPVSSAAAARPRNQSDRGKTHDHTSLLRNGFPLLLTIGVIDSATRMGFLTFLPFLLRAKGAGVPEIGAALTLIFAGGAAGKLVCGFLGARLGILPTVLLTEGATAAGIVPDLTAVEQRDTAFGVFYTGTIGAGALSPALYGLFSDAIGLSAAMLLVAMVVLLTFPLAWQLTRMLAALPSGPGLLESATTDDLAGG
jgi:MFS transporter, FSR family, fosmidomycin resistance protein